jgi:hypothetical protein
MPTLFLSAPGSGLSRGIVRTFDVRSILISGVAPDYAIATNLIEQVYAGMRVVVFDRDRKEQLEGVVASYTPTVKAENGIQRYDVLLRNCEMVSYSKPPQVNHCGVAIG